MFCRDSFELSVSFVPGAAALPVVAQPPNFALSRQGTCAVQELIGEKNLQRTSATLSNLFCYFVCVVDSPAKGMPGSSCALVAHFHSHRQNICHLVQEDALGIAYCN